MRHVQSCDPPDELSGPKSAGEREREEAIAFYKVRAHKESGFPFHAYKAKSVTARLEEMFAHKCAYCETNYASNQPMEVEHYRPKGAYLLKKPKPKPKKAKTAPKPTLAKPGYYWLAADWSNLLPSCIDCNRARNQEIGEVTELAGKANQFPIKDERRRAKRPGDERKEGRLLLHPCLDEPDRHLFFDDKGFVDPARESRGRQSEMGKASIEVYALDRKGLVDARAEKLKRMQVVMARIEKIVRELDERPGDDFLAELVVDARKELEAEAAPEKEYSAMARQAIDRFEKRLLGGSGA